MADKILLEAGTNEMELLVFRLGVTHFGVNVAKVREILSQVKTHMLPHTPPAVEGNFLLRKQSLLLLNLARHFDIHANESSKAQGIIIVVEFNNVQCGILVDSVEVIHRLKWDEIEPPSGFLMREGVPVTGTAIVENRIVLIVDFETTVGDILGLETIGINLQTEKKSVSLSDARIILADDSPRVCKVLINILRQSGYENVTMCTNGQEVWEKLEAQQNDIAYDLVLTDLEMPKMDGFHLTSKIKNHAKYSQIPVVIFSSLVTKDNIKKGEAVGANAQVSKTDSAGIIKAIEDCLKKK